MPEGNGTVLDQSLILFGSNMANSDAHNNDPLPQALIGRGGGVKGNQHLHYPQDTPHANILVTMLNRAGVPAQTSRSSPTTPARSRKCDREAPFDSGHRGRSAGGGRAPGDTHRPAQTLVACGSALSRDHVTPKRTSTAATPMAARRCSGRSMTGNVAEVKRLLRAGADVSLANNYGATPMSLAAEVGNTEMLKVLLEVGANADSPNRRRADRTDGGGENGQRGSRAAAAGPRRQPSMRERSGVGRPR